MIENKLSDENKKIANKLKQYAKTILKLYIQLINNEVSNGNDKKLVANTIDKLLMVIEQENLILDNQVNIDNVDPLIEFIENELDYFGSRQSTGTYDDLRLLVLRRVQINLLVKEMVLKKIDEEIKFDMLCDLEGLYHAKILEDEASINPNHRKELIQKKYFTYYLNNKIENLVITNSFIANTDYPNFMNCINSSVFSQSGKNEHGKDIISQAIAAIESLDDAFGFEATLRGIHLRSCFLLVNDSIANEIVRNYVDSFSYDEEYTENAKIIVDAYHESREDRHKYIQKYVFVEEDNIKDSNEVQETLNLFIERAKNILKLYKKIIELKTVEDENLEEIGNYRDYIQSLVENEANFYKEVLSRKENSIKKEIYRFLYDKLFGCTKKNNVSRFNSILMDENSYPEIRVLSLLNIFLIKNGISMKERFAECEEMVSLMYLMRLLESDNPYTCNSKVSALDKSHMISYLNPEIENLTLCNLFYGINNYPDQILEKQSDDQKFKNEVAQNIITEVINQLLAYDNIDNEALGIQCLYLQSTLMLADDYIVAQLKRNIIDILKNNAQRITELKNNSNSIETNNQIKLLKIKDTIIKNILVAINESRNEKERLKSIKTYEKELNR